MTELKLCPFCGGRAEIREVSHGIGKEQFAVVCNECGASSKARKPYGNYRRSYYREDARIIAQVDAAIAWNRRADDGN